MALVNAVPFLLPGYAEAGWPAKVDARHSGAQQSSDCDEHITNDVLTDEYDESAPLLDKATAERYLSAVKRSVDDREGSSFSTCSSNSSTAALLSSPTPFATSHVPPSFTSYDRLAAWLVNILFFLVVIGFAVFETLVVVFTKRAYGWERLENGGVFAGCAAMTVLSLMVMKWVRSGRTVAGGQDACDGMDNGVVVECEDQSGADGFNGNSTDIDATQQPSHQPSRLADDRLFLMGGLLLMITCMLLMMNPLLPPPLPLVQFLVVALFLFAPGFAVAQTSCFILFSKVLGEGGRRERCACVWAWWR